VPDLATLVRLGGVLIDPILPLPRLLGHAALLEAMLLVASESKAVPQEAASPRVPEHVLVDRFVGDADSKLELEPSADLLRAPAQLQLLLDQFLQFPLDLPAVLAFLDATLMRLFSSTRRKVELSRRRNPIAAQLAADGRGGTPETPRDLRLTAAFLQTHLDVVSLFESQLSVHHRPLFVAVEERMCFRRLTLFLVARYESFDGGADAALRFRPEPGP